MLLMIMMTNDDCGGGDCGDFEEEEDKDDEDDYDSVCRWCSIMI